MKRLFIPLIILFIFLSGCSNKVSNPNPSQDSSTKQVAKSQQSQTVQSTPPHTSDNSTTHPAKIASAQIANGNTQNNKSKSQTTSAAKITTTPKPSSQKTQIQRTPNILGSTDTNASFSYIKSFGFNITAPLADTVSINNFRVSWDGSGSPNFELRLIDWTNNPNEEVIFWAYIGNMHSYTIPASLLKVGHEYEVQLEATNGTNYEQPGYETLRPKNLSAGNPVGFNVKVTN